MEHFKDPKKVGHGFVQEGRYEIKDSEHNIVTQEDWKPELGMVFGITVIFTYERRLSSASIMCPYCKNIAKYDEIVSGSPLTWYVILSCLLSIMSDGAPAHSHSATTHFWCLIPTPTT